MIQVVGWHLWVRLSTIHHKLEHLSTEQSLNNNYSYIMGLLFGKTDCHSFWYFKFQIDITHWILPHCMVCLRGGWLQPDGLGEPRTTRGSDYKKKKDWMSSLNELMFGARQLGVTVLGACSQDAFHLPAYSCRGVQSSQIE